MTKHLLIADDFAHNPYGIREQALKLDYAPREFHGVTYNGMAGGYDPGLQERIEQLVGFPIVKVLDYFRLAPIGDETTVWIHADTGVDGAEWAGVLYLNPTNYQGGTAFWTHQGLGIDRIPQVVTPDLAARLNQDGNNESVWGMNTLAGMKFNRFIAYPTRYFHSRYPREAWGDGKEGGRLVWVCFFNRKSEAA